MADTKISALTALTGATLDVADVLPIVDTSAVQTKGITVTELLKGILGSVSLTGLTVTTSQPLINMAQTWNAGAVAFTGLKFSVTDTACATGSYLFDFTSSVGGAYLRGTKNGIISASSGFQIWSSGSSSFLHGEFSGNGLAFRSGGALVWSASTSWSAGDPFNSPDVALYRDASAMLALRNATTAQTFNIYRTWTDASNYQRLTHKWNTTTAVIHNEGLGTGADGNIAFNDAALATTATLGYIMIPSCAGAPTGVPADIPTGQIPVVFDSTNNKLYVYDGGWISTAALT